jgi:tetratricopeptide (TPR) repeat protein
VDCDSLMVDVRYNKKMGDAGTSLLHALVLEDSSFLRRLAWRFTASGRLRVRVWRARRDPKDLRCVDALRHAAARLESRCARDAGSDKSLLLAALASLTWLALQRRDWDEAEAGLSRLARLVPEFAGRPWLRSDLLQALQQSQEWQRYPACATAFLSESLAEAQEYREPLQVVLATVYERFSASTCGTVLKRAGVPLAPGSWVKAVQDLSGCPPSFPSREDALTWAKRVPPEQFAFSESMRVDALIVQARSAEWSGDWVRMEQMVAQAAALAPDNVSVKYWAARAWLHSPPGTPWGPFGISLVAQEKGTRWERLRLQVQLHGTPNLKLASAVAVLLERHASKMEEPERTLIVDLLHRAIQADASTRYEGTSRAAAVCTIVERTVGALPWVQTQIARSEIRDGAAYVSAYQRLEKCGTARDPEMLLLWRVARLLAGEPAEVGGAPETADDLVSLLSRCVRLLLVSSETALRREKKSRQEGRSRPGEDDLGRQFPVLRDLFEVLRFAVRACRSTGCPGESGSPNAKCRVGEPVPAPAPATLARVPAWARTIAQRARMLHAAEDSLMSWADTLPRADEAWAFEGWTRNTRRLWKVPPACIQAVADTLHAALESLREDERAFVERIRGGREEAYDRLAAVPPSPWTRGGFESLGGVLDQSLGWEMNAEMQFHSAREALRRGETEAAWTMWADLDRDLEARGILFQAWWRPVVRYWLAVATVKGRPADAQALWRALLGGPKDGEARGQLALAALAAGDPEECESWVASAPPEVPAVRYASAVLLSRRGQYEEALSSLETADARTILECSSYRVAAERLKGVLHERSGRRAEAQQVYETILKTCPGEPVVTARWLRVRTRASYEQLQVTPQRPCEGADPTSGRLTEELFRTVPWGAAYLLLERLLDDPSVDFHLPQWQEHVAGGRIPVGRLSTWVQLLAHRLLALGHSTEAVALLPVLGDLEAPPRCRRTAFILTTWSMMAGITSDTAALRSGAEEPLGRGADDLERTANDPPPDPQLQQWRSLADAWARISAADNAEMALKVWRDLNPLPQIPAARLWDDDPKTRTETAAQLRARIDAAPQEGTGEQRTLWAALAALVQGRDEDFLQNYERLEGRMDTLPVDPVGLWTAAAALWLRAADWNQLLVRALPACVADLSVPKVRLILGAAYALAATEDVTKGRVRSAVQRIRQAYGTLEFLVPHDGQGDERSVTCADQGGM